MPSIPSAFIIIFTMISFAVLGWTEIDWVAAKSLKCPSKILLKPLPPPETILETD